MNSIYSESTTGKYEPRIGPDPTKDGPEELFATDLDAEDDEDGYETDWVNPKAKSLVVRGTSIEIVHERAAYESLGIKLEDSKRIYVFELLRALVVEHKNKFLFSDEQLRRILPSGIKKVLQLEEWHHIGQDGWGKPSKSETFQMLAKVLVTGDSKEYRPSQTANTHWSHWPEGGQL